MDSSSAELVVLPCSAGLRGVREWWQKAEVAGSGMTDEGGSAVEGGRLPKQVAMSSDGPDVGRGG